MDWQRFFDENYIPYVTRGPNTKQGEISIKCPMCIDDPSEHMGINLTTGFWGCHRNQAHRGKSLRYLIKAISNCSSHQAQSIIRQYSRADPDDDMGRIVAAFGNADDPAKFVKEKQAQKHGPEFASFHSIYNHGSTKRFFNYLKDRGFGDATSDLIADYNLKCATVGKYKDRIIIPTYHSGELMAWTSRAIGNPRNAPRYLASSDDLKATIFDYDRVKQGGRRLFVVEGPFDALALNAAAMLHGYTYRATCTFGTSVTVGQYALLRKVASNFDEVFVMFDRDANPQAAEVAEWLGVRQAVLPVDTKDPGELNREELAELNYRAFNGWFVQTFRSFG